MSPLDRKGKRRELMMTTCSERVWKHCFLCLSSRDKTNVPDGTEKAFLKLAGLGEKLLTLITTEALTNQLYHEFGQL